MLDEIRDWGWAILFVLAAAYMALRDKLGLDFVRKREYAETIGKLATKEDLNGVGTRVNAFETVLINTRDTADANSDRLTKLEEATNAERQALSRTLSRIDQTMTDMDRRQREDRSLIDRAVTLMDALERRMDRHSPHD